MVEAAFAATLGKLGDGGPALGSEGRELNGHASQPTRTEASADVVLTVSKPVRERDRDHLRFVASEPCLICGRAPSDAHHIKFAEQRAMGRKVSDKFTVPICRLHHRELHRRGNERAWWKNKGIDPLPIAASLWTKTHAASSAEADNASNVDKSIELNGKHLANERGTDLQGENDETKPIVHPEAG